MSIGYAHYLFFYLTTTTTTTTDQGSPASQDYFPARERTAGPVTASTEVPYRHTIQSYLSYLYILSNFNFNPYPTTISPCLSTCFYFPCIAS